MAKKIDQVMISGKKSGVEVNVGAPSFGRREGTSLSRPILFGKKDTTQIENVQINNPKDR